MKRLEISIQSPTKTLQFPEVRLNRGLATYIDKEKVSGWLMPTPYMGSGASLDPKHLSTANIIQNFQNPKIEASPKEKEIYRNENAAEQISGSDNSHLYARLLSTANVIQNLPNPKVSTKNSLITPEMDASYLDAVERGANGLWRYEIPDVQIKRPDEWMGMRNIRLKDVVSGAEELFEAYPELADIKIKKGRGKGGGSYTHENKTIELGVAHLKGWIDALRNPSAYYSSYEEIEAGLLRQAAHLRSTLIHEIQHAIQRIEGFAQGGNSTMILDASARAKYDEMIESYNERVDKYNKMSVAEQRTTEGRDLANRLGSQRKAIDMFWKLNSIGASGYKRLAGEVEARNVEKRAGMSMAERLATLVEETEDVAREDQIFLRDGVEIAMVAKKKSADETVSPNNSDHPAAISSADGAKILKNIDNLARKYQEKSNRPDTFIGDVAGALGISMPNKSSKYRTYETLSGEVVTIRLSNHGATASKLDANNETNAVSIVIANRYDGITADGEAHIIEYFYDAIKLRKADGKPLVDIINSLKQTLYSGIYIDNTGIAEVKEINSDPHYSLITPEMDASYLDAVERGDMATAQKMVMEAAEKGGYINDESWRMNHRAPRKDEENANPFNTEKIVPKDFWEHPEWYTNIRHSSETRESYYAMKSAIDKYKRLMAEGKTEEAENVTITMYRGVDKTANKREASFRNGDWITPSRSYALLSAPYGKARVISQEVKLKDIWWDGNSIAEWGYDDGANYGYRDTKNNRKLLDPVTYDDAGNVIPLSERFNPRKEDIRYSLIGEMGASNIESYGRYGSPAYALEQARDMEADGKSVKEIRVATNWERGKDGKWRYEINDGVYIDPEDKDKEYKLSDILKNDALYEAYSELADMPVYYAELEGNQRGMYDGEAIWLSNTLDEQQAHSTLVHEVQHAIQHREGFARGGNKGMFEQEAIEKLEQTLGDLEKEKDKFKSYNKLRKAYLILKYVANSLRLDRAESKAYEQYRRLAGEVEARNVQARMNMSEEERLLIPIGSTEDVARSSQNVIQRELMAADGTRYSLREESAPTRYSLQSGDMPFFNDNGDIITFDNTDITGEDYDAIELRSPMPTTPRTTKDVIKAHLSARHNAAKELFENQKISVPLRDSFIGKIVNELHNEYKSRKEGEDFTGADSANREEANKVDNQGLWRGYSEAGPSGDIARRGRVLAPTRYSLQSDDIPLLRDNLLKQKDRYEKGRGETAFVINRDDNGKSTESNINGNNRNIEKDGAYWRPSNKKQRSSLQDTDNGEITEGTFGDRRGSKYNGDSRRDILTSLSLPRHFGFPRCFFLFYPITTLQM